MQRRLALRHQRSKRRNSEAHAAWPRPTDEDCHWNSKSHVDAGPANPALEQLLAAMSRVTTAQPRVTALADNPGYLRAVHIVRVRSPEFPGSALVQTLPGGNG